MLNRIFQSSKCNFQFRARLFSLDSNAQNTLVENLKEKFKEFDQPNYFDSILSKYDNVKSLRRASVLVPISFKEVIDEHGFRTVKSFYTLSKRTDKMTSFRGDVSFLGGKRDRSDKNDIETAYREAQEEAGINSKDCTYLAQLCPIVTFNSILVTPVLVHFNKKDYVPVLNTDEVELVFELPTQRFLTNEGHTTESLETSGNLFSVHHFKDMLGERELETWGYTAFMCVIISTLIHSQEPSFKLVPYMTFKPENMNEMLEAFLHKKLSFIEES